MRPRGSRAIYYDNIEAFALAVVVYCTASRSYTIAVSEADCGLGANSVR
jgi:hypothetical protein